MATNSARANNLAIEDKKKELFRKIYRYKAFYIMIAPGIIFFLIFHYAPLYGIILAFKKFMYNQGITGSPWVGLDNFRVLMSDNEFWRAFKNTVIISLGKILTGFPAPIILSLLLNELRNQKYKRVIQSILYLPHFLSWIILSGLIFNMFSFTSGTLNKILVGYLGLEPIKIIGNDKFFRPLVYLSHIWKTAGWGTIVYLAAISGIDPSIYESAVIDGAGRFKQMIHITIPSLRYAIITLLILDLGHVMNAGFDQIFNLYDPGTYNVGDIIDTYVYRLGIISSKFEISTAVGLFKSIINCLFLITANSIIKRLGEEGLY